MRLSARQAELELAQEIGELALLGRGERAQDPALVVEVVLDGRVDERAAGLRQRDQDPAAIVGVALAGDQLRLLEAVEPLGRAARRQHERVREVRRAQPVGRARTAQRREDVVPAWLEPVVGVDRLEPPLDLARQTRDPPDHADRRAVEIRALAVPLLEEHVDSVLRHTTSLAIPYGNKLSWDVVSKDVTS